MPILKPKPRETKSEFISRFMSNKLMEKEYKPKQRLAIAYKTWREHGV